MDEKKTGTETEIHGQTRFYLFLTNICFWYRHTIFFCVADFRNAFVTMITEYFILLLFLVPSYPYKYKHDYDYMIFI